MKKAKIEKWYRDLEKEIGKEKAKEVEVMFNILVASILDDQLEILEELGGIMEKVNNSIKLYKNKTQGLIKKLRSGDKK